MDDYFYYLRGVRQKNKELIPGEIYHIIQRAPGKELLFVEDNDYLHFIQIFKKMAKKFDFNVNAFCLMPNHLHIMGGSMRDNFSDAMQYLFKSYALYFNTKYQRKGHVFHGPFRVVPVDSERYMIILSTYIHLNPVKAGLCESSESWKWSSIELYYYPKRKSFVNPKPILTLLNDNLKSASEAYRKIISDLEGREEVKIESESKKAISSFLATTFRYFSQIFKENYMKEEYEILSNLDKMAQTKSERDFERLFAKLYAMEQLMARGYDIDLIASLLNISRTTCYRYMKRIKKENANQGESEPQNVA